MNHDSLGEKKTKRCVSLSYLPWTPAIGWSGLLDWAPAQNRKPEQRDTLRVQWQITASFLYCLMIKERWWELCRVEEVRSNLVLVSISMSMWQRWMTHAAKLLLLLNRKIGRENGGARSRAAQAGFLLAPRTMTRSRQDSLTCYWPA